MNETYQLLSRKKFYRNESEHKNKIFRRSIFAVKNIKKGQIFNSENIRRIRPGYGLPPKYYEKLLKKKSPISIKAGEPLTTSILKKIFF